MKTRLAYLLGILITFHSCSGGTAEDVATQASEAPDSIISVIISPTPTPTPSPTSTPAPCAVFESKNIGTVAVSLSGSNATVNWTNNLSSFSDSLSVSLSGPTSVSSVSNTKPAVFNSLADGSWTATVTYVKSGCTSLTATRIFTVNASVDCTAWNGMTVGTVTKTLQNPATSVSIDWSGGTVTGQDSFEVSLSGATVSSPTINTKPKVFSSLNSGAHTATVLYKKAGCSDLSASITFNVASLSAHIYPVLSSKCTSCHTPGGSDVSSFAIGANAGTLYTELTSSAHASCSPGAAHVERVNTTHDPADATNSFFYRKVNTTGCGTKMKSNGNLTDAQVALILHWIENGANND